MNAKMTAPDGYTQRAGARVLEGIPSAHPNGNCGRSADSRMEPLHPAEVERSNR